MKNAQLSAVPIGLWLAAVMTACGGGAPDGSTQMDAEGGKARVLIAVRPSDFKQQIVGKLTARYSGQAELTLLDIDDLDQVRESDYDGMVVMGARMGWLMFSAEERHFLDNLKTPSKLVMVMTAAIRDWKWDRKDIDVISCASKPENVELVFNEVSTRLDGILKK